MEYNDRMLKAALSYREDFEFCVIPSGKNKQPLIAWKEFQNRMVTTDEIRSWWTDQFPGANISMVCGRISNRIVVDVDTYKKPESLNEIEEVTPESLLMPIVDTPRGGEHRHFLYDEKVKCSGENDKFIDVKSDGGLVMLPPSSVNNKEYTWRNGFNVRNIPTPFLPYAYIEFFNKHLYTNSYIINCKNHATTTIDNNRQQSTTIYFDEGHRDATLFHLANYLVKSGMPVQEIQEYLLFMGVNCNPPFPEKEIYTKIQSAIQRARVNEKGLTESIREFIRQQSGNITATTIQHATTIDNNPQERKKIYIVMARLEKEGLLKKTGKRAGEYRIIANEHEVQDWKNASVESVKMELPLGMHQAVRIVPGSIMMFSGVTNTGKTAFGMNIARLNCGRGKVTYLTSEIEKDEFRARVDAYCRNQIDDSIDKWDVELIAKFAPDSLPDLINPDGLNIIDYLEPPAGDFTKIGPLITDIHHALRSGVAVINIQKKDNDEYGSGGQFIRNKAHLFCTLDVKDYPVCRLKITKCKAPNHGYRNPVGLDVEYKISVKDGLHIEPFGKFRFTRWDNN